MSANINNIRDIKGTQLVSDSVGEALVGTIGTPIAVSFTDTATAVSTLIVGQLYDVLADQPCSILNAASGDAVAATSVPIPAECPIPITASVTRVSVIRRGTISGTIWFTPRSKYEG